MYASNSYFGVYLGEWLGNGANTIPVSSDFLVNWNTNNSIQASNSIAWNIINSTQTSASVDWNTSTSAVNSYNTGWNSQSNVLSNFQVNYNIDSLTLTTCRQVNIRFSVNPHIPYIPVTRLISIKREDRIIHI